MKLQIILEVEIEDSQVAEYMLEQCGKRLMVFTGQAPQPEPLADVMIDTLIEHVKPSPGDELFEPFFSEDWIPTISAVAKPYS